MQTFISNPAKLEADFFRGLNSLIEPFIRAGFASLPCSPMGLIVLETTGRKTARKFNIPLMATHIGRFVLVSTFRNQSEWIKNLRANSQIRYWLGGKAHEATAIVLTGKSTDPELKKLSPFIKNFVDAQRQYLAMFGGHVAILMPRE
jgi:deazaflavin-dependent oxidoreductase (nitroreductase family)